MATIEISREEVESGQISLANHAAAVYSLQTDGFVVLKDVIDTAHLDVLHDRMLQDLDTILQRPDAPFNFNTGNVQQDPPPFPPYLFRDVLVNDIVIAVTKSILGPKPQNSFYSGNTALPGGTRQPVHPDTAQLWPDLPTATPAFGLVVNVPVVDMDERNGSTEIWPGTHLDTTYNIHQGSARISEDVLERRRAIEPPIQPAVTRGSVVIRDIRLWHAGMPNQTGTPRPMIAMIHWCSWWADSSVPFAKGTEEIFAHPDLKTNALFTDEPIDYLHHNEAYDLQK
jgi:Phytanoyl-CoA dioxygenase (PhyH)